MNWDRSSPIPRFKLLLIYLGSNSGVTPAVCNGTLYSPLDLWDIFRPQLTTMTVGDMAFQKNPERQPFKLRNHTIDPSDSAELKPTPWDMAVSRRGNEDEANPKSHLEDD